MTTLTSMEQQFIEKLTAVIDANLHNEDFGVTELATELGMSRVTLHRKVRSIIKKSVSEFIRETRLERALKLLQQKAGSVAEISYKVGFGSPTYFNKCFHDHYGFPPGEVLKGMHEPVEPKSTKKSFRAKLQSSKILYILPVIIILATVAFVFFQNKQSNTIKKTIAVLPPKDIGLENTPCVILEGFVEHLHSKLTNVNQFDLKSLTTTNTYRKAQQNSKQLARELNVNYIIEVKGQTVNEQSTVWVNLINAKADRSIWSYPYERNVTTDNFNEIQKELAQLVAESLNVEFSDKEIKKINKKQTNNPAALRNYNLGIYQLSIYGVTKEFELLLKAKKHIETAIYLDPKFADAYKKLADILISHLCWTVYDKKDKEDLFDNYMDSGLVCINKAIELGPSNLHSAYHRKSIYYQWNNDYNNATYWFDKAWGNKKKNYQYYGAKGNFYYRFTETDYYKSLSNFLRYFDQLPDTVFPDLNILSRTASQLGNNGFYELAIDFRKKQYEENLDSAALQKSIAGIYQRMGNYDLTIKLLKNDFEKMPDNLQLVDNLTFCLVMQRRFEELDEIYSKVNIDSLVIAKYGEKTGFAYFGYYLLINGEPEKARWHFENNAKKIKHIIETKNNEYTRSYMAHAYLAGCYSCLEDKKNAIKYLSMLKNKKNAAKITIYQLKESPVYDNIRNESEFIEVMNYLESLNNKQHQKIKKLLLRYGYKPA